MRRAVLAEAATPIVRSWATRATSGCRPYDDGCRAFRILEFLRKHMRFTPDPLGVEAFGTPAFLLSQLAAEGRIYGDCDDAAVLGAALARAVGLRARFAVASFRPDGAFHHVWPEAYAGGAWFEMDPFRSERFGGLPTRSLHVGV